MATQQIQEARGEGALTALRAEIIAARTKGRAREGVESRVKEAPDMTMFGLIEGRGGETILLVDDDDDVRDVVRALLLKSGYAVIEAASGGEALRIAREHQGRIDVLLTDVNMPRMDGPELADRLAGLRSETKILFMSGFTAETLSPSELRAGEMRLLAKPFSLDQLKRYVRGALDGDPIVSQGI